MANMINLLNTIRANASDLYRSRIPEATEDNIAAVGNPILNYSTVQNEFVGELINRIALTIVSSKIARNPLKALKKGGIPLGQDVQDIFVNMAKGEEFDKDSTDLLKNYTPDVKVCYYRMNRRNKYPVTVSYDMLKTAFTSYQDLENMISGIVSSLYSGDEQDEFLLMKNLVTSAVQNGLVKCKKVTAPTDEASSKQFIKELRTYSGLFKFPSAKYNMYKSYAEQSGLTNPTDVVTWAPVSSQILLVKSEILANNDVEVLASAFHMDKAQFLGRVVEVDQFDEEGKIQCILCDEAFFQVWDNLTTIRDFENIDTLSRKYILHRWETLAVSPFANAICLITDLVAPTKIEADDVTVTAGDTATDKPIVLTFVPDNGAVDKTVTYLSSDNTTATVSDLGVVHGVAEGTATITITSGATYPTGATPASKQITVTVQAGS